MTDILVLLKSKLIHLVPTLKYNNSLWNTFLAKMLVSSENLLEHQD